MCHVLGVKSNNYYSYQKRKLSKTDNLAHQKIIELIKYIAKFSDNTYGTRRIKKVLNTLSFPVSRRKTTQLMREANIWGRYKNKYKATTNSDHYKPVYQNELKLNFTVAEPDQAWVVISLTFGLHNADYIYAS